jgi:hypothetical protein
MSLIVIPLAGPDFYTAKFGIRPLYPIGDKSLIEYVLSSRPWYLEVLEGGSQIIFVLREEEPHTKKMLTFIKDKFPYANTIVLGNLSAGSLMSALAGVALSRQQNMPVIIDLADIVFDMKWHPELYFDTNLDVDAVAPYFSSNDPKFSYFKLDGIRVIMAREKQVISRNASAGVYVFRDVASYLKATIYCLNNPEICKVGSDFFVCPSLNGLIMDKRQVHGVKVHNVKPISTIFHQSLLGQLDEF